MNKYEIGFARPPKHSQFKPGQSGNSKGRPRGSKNTYKLLDELLSQKLIITQDGRQVKINKKTAALLQAVNSATKGNLKALQVLLPHMLIADAKNEERAQTIKILRQDDAKIIEQFLKGVKDESTDS